MHSPKIEHRSLVLLIKSLKNNKKKLPEKLENTLKVKTIYKSKDQKMFFHTRYWHLSAIHPALQGVSKLSSIIL